MKKKILVIFFLALIPLYIIYKIYRKEEYNYLAIGDELAKGHTPFNEYNISYTDFLFDYLKQQHRNATINKNYIKEDMRINDLFTELIKIDKNSLSYSIKNADIITLSIGSEEIFNKLKSNYEIYKENPKLIYNYIDDLFTNLSHLLKEFRKLSKKDIYIIGYYSPLEYNEENHIFIDSLFNYIDMKFKELEKNPKVIYIDIYHGFKNNPNYLPNKNHTFPSLDGYNYISNQIIKKIES